MHRRFFINDDINSFITYVSNEASDVKLEKKDDHILDILFDYLQKKDKIVLTILHTGKIELLGTLKTGKMVESKIYNNILYKNIFFIFASVFSTFALVCCVEPTVTITILATVLLIYLMAIELINYAKK